MSIISVIVPVYNCENYINRCINSILNQTIGRENIEIIIIDDASTDNSRKIICKFLDKNVKIITNDTNIGTGPSRNIGIDLSRGDYIIFVDGDDFIRKDCLEILLRKADNEKCIVVSGMIRINNIFKTINVNRDITNIKNSILKCKLSLSCCGILIHKSLIKNNFENIKHEDINFMTDLYISNYNKIYLTNEVLYYYYHNSMSRSKIYTLDDALEWVKSWIYVKDKIVSNDKDYEAWSHSLENIIIKEAAKRLQANNTDLNIFNKELEELFKKYNLNFTNIKQALNKSRISKYYFDDYRWECLKDAVIFIADVNYHIKNFVEICRRLIKKDIKCAILDLEEFNKYNRTCTSEEKNSFKDITVINISYDAIKLLPYCIRACVVAIDWRREIRDFIYQLQLLGIPTIGFYEGICDDFNIETKRNYLPYRLIDNLLVPGEFYKNIYKNNVYVVGSPLIQSLYKKKVEFPNKKTAVINLNFSYNVCESFAEEWLSKTVSACKKCGIEYIISKHPADTTKLLNEKPSEDSIYECIYKSSLLISRFSTCIIESLAMGKPVIYFNPHRERFATFSNPKGAFEIAYNEEDLCDKINRMIKKINSNFDFKKNAIKFLNDVIDIENNSDSSERCACAIENILHSDINNKTKSNLINFIFRTPLPVRDEVNSIDIIQKNKNQSNDIYNFLYNIYLSDITNKKDFDLKIFKFNKNYCCIKYVCNCCRKTMRYICSFKPYIFSSLPDTAIFFCDSCGSIRTPHIYESQSVFNDNDTISCLNNSLQNHIKREKRNRNYAINLLENVDKIVQKKPKLFLEIGSGPGWFLDEAKKKGFTTVGYELSKECVDYGKESLSLNLINDYFSQDSIQNLYDTFGSNTLYSSIIVCTMVLEHIQYPESLCSAIAMYCKKTKSCALVSVPIINYLNPFLDSLVNINDEKSIFRYAPGHTFHYTSQGFKLMWTSYGASKIEKVKIKGTFPFLYKIIF